MKSFKKIIFLIFLMFLPLIFSYCTKYKELVPFTDGLTLTYTAGGIGMIFNVQELDDSKFKIIKTEKREPLSDKIEELLVDKYGKVYKSSIKDYEGGFSPIWIPVHKMEIGDSFDKGYTIIRKDKWKKWDVMVVKTPDINEEQYFELNTGYLVGIKGKFGMRYEFMLIDTNADIPTAEE